MLPDYRRRAVHRARILEGQLRSLTAAIEADEYCVDLLTRSLALQRGLASLNKLLVENHLREHVPAMLAEGGDTAEHAVAELVRIFELSNNRGD